MFFFLQDYKSLEARLHALEKDINGNHETIKEIHELLRKINAPNEIIEKIPDPQLIDHKPR